MNEPCGGEQPADDEGLFRSYYLLEFLFEETPSNFDMGYLSSDPAEIRAALVDQYEHRRWGGFGEQVCLWVAQRGTLTHAYDLNPLIRTPCRDGVVRSLAEIREIYAAGRFDNDKHYTAGTFTSDLDAVTAPLPALAAPLARPGEEDLVLLVPDELEHDVPLSIDDQEWLGHGWTDVH
ncbi:hypothetical protein [Actinomadura harenae]|uniref:Uncharacterized protein n=1 Tax=Actinomadura harenae TaxID=2483351 RepID=A0A3M2LNS2_9ACTN|nr:hypothetical protein [Actinomadura harenae]RMI39002.1 hypothetical protein EBO15_31050 [Actinomadura harenae]